jgi:hypothetical protein
MGMAYSTNGAKRNACRILMGELEGKRSLGRPRRRWVNNIIMNLREIGWDGMDRFSLGPVEGSCELGNETSGSIICWEVLE